MVEHKHFMLMIKYFHAKDEEKTETRNLIESHTTADRTLMLFHIIKHSQLYIVRT